MYTLYLVQEKVMGKCRCIFYRIDEVGGGNYN